MKTGANIISLRLLLTVGVALFSSGHARSQAPYGGLLPPQQRPLTNASPQRVKLPEGVLNPNSQRAPSPDAYRQIDSGRLIDPRILEQQRLEKEAQEKQQRVDAVKLESLRELAQKVRANPQLNGLEGNARVSLSMAMRDAINYNTLRKLEGGDSAERWLGQRKDTLRAEGKRLEGTQDWLVLHDDIVLTAAALAGKPSPEMEALGFAKPGTGRAASTAQQANPSGIDLQLQYLDVLVR